MATRLLHTGVHLASIYLMHMPLFNIYTLCSVLKVYRAVMCGCLCITGTPLTLKTVFNALHSVSHKWLSIGVELGIPLSQLNIIKIDRLGVEERMHSVLDYWMNNAADPLPSWEVLVDALRAPTVGESRLADELEVLERHYNPENKSILGEWEPIQAKCCVLKDRGCISGSTCWKCSVQSRNLHHLEIALCILRLRKLHANLEIAQPT